MGESEPGYVRLLPSALQLRFAVSSSSSCERPNIAAARPIGSAKRYLCIGKRSIFSCRLYALMCLCFTLLKKLGAFYDRIQVLNPSFLLVMTSFVGGNGWLKFMTSYVPL